ncbi:MAG: Recombination protein RecR [Chlamydiia bacterium]|nr:Recombination protein RecR [Chlamydiia bacterium]
MKKYPEPIQKIIQYLRKLPGVGNKTAERFAFHILDWDSIDQTGFSNSLATLKTKVKTCDECGCYKDASNCTYCTKGHDLKTLCIIAKAKDVYTIDHMNAFSGYFHVIGSLISPLEGKMPEDLCLNSLSDRIDKLQIEEVIIALDSTLEGDATALYLHKAFKNKKIKITKLALGIPIGSTLEYVDEGTLSQAFASRHTLAEKN